MATYRSGLSRTETYGEGQGVGVGVHNGMLSSANRSFKFCGL